MSARNGWLSGVAVNDCFNLLPLCAGVKVKGHVCVPRCETRGAALRGYLAERQTFSSPGKGAPKGQKGPKSTRKVLNGPLAPVSRSSAGCTVEASLSAGVA